MEINTPTIKIQEDKDVITQTNIEELNKTVMKIYTCDD